MAYFKYVTSPTVVANDMRADLIKLITGASLADCSSSCNQSLSQQWGTSYGWSILDQYGTAPSFSYTITSTDNDGIQKYYNLQPYSQGFIASSYESWNSTTHTGVAPSNGSSNSASYWTSILPSMTTSSVYWIFVTDSYVAFSSSATAGALLGEVLRDGPCFGTSKLDGTTPHATSFTMSLAAAAGGAVGLPRLWVPTAMMGSTAAVSGTGASSNNSLLIQAIGGAAPNAASYLVSKGGASFYQSTDIHFVYNSTKVYAGRFRGGIKWGHTSYTGLNYGDTITDGVNTFFPVGDYLIPMV